MGQFYFLTEESSMAELQDVVVRCFKDVNPDVDRRVELVLYYRARTPEEIDDPLVLARFYGANPVGDAETWCANPIRFKEIVGRIAKTQLL